MKFNPSKRKVRDFLKNFSAEMGWGTWKIKKGEPLKWNYLAGDLVHKYYYNHCNDNYVQSMMKADIFDVRLAHMHEEMDCCPNSFKYQYFALECMASHILNFNHILYNLHGISNFEACPLMFFTGTNQCVLLVCHEQHDALDIAYFCFYFLLPLCFC